MAFWLCKFQRSISCLLKGILVLTTCIEQVGVQLIWQTVFDIFNLNSTFVTIKVKLKPWPELIGYFLQMDLPEPEMSHCIILTLIFNQNLFSPLNSIVLHASFHAFIDLYCHLTDLFNNKSKINTTHSIK